MEEGRTVIFGAGKYGRIALEELGKDRVKYFVDNSVQKQKDLVGGIPVYPVSYLVEVHETDRVLICGMSYMTMEQQLIDLGVTNYKLFEPIVHYYPTTDMIYNPYDNKVNLDLNEESWVERTNENKIIEYIAAEVDFLKDKDRLFSHIEIETVNRCNGNCDFCPVSKKNDTRELHIMTDELFEKIIGELADINYSGRLALFSNNEPFLDPKIIERNRYAREKLPNAKMHLFTNGTLLDMDKFLGIVENLNELIIDNYQQELQLLKPCKEIVEYCEQHHELKKKVTIVLRKPHEILTTRGGDAPNRSIKKSYGGAKCTLPYKQMIVRPDGKISLCCNDALGKMSLGDLTVQTVVEAWNSPEYRRVRKLLAEGREKIKLCKYCDYFAIG